MLSMTELLQLSEVELENKILELREDLHQSTEHKRHLVGTVLYLQGQIEREKP